MSNEERKTVSEARLTAQNIVRLTNVIRLPDGLKYPTEVKKKIKAQSVAVEAWSKAELARSEAHAVVDSQKFADDAAMRTAARDGLPDPRDPEQMAMLVRVLEFATVREEETRKKANLAGVDLRDSLQEHQDEIIALVTELFEENFAEYDKAIKNIVALYHEATTPYKERNDTINLLIKVTKGHNPQLGRIQRELEPPRYEESGERSLNILRSFTEPTKDFEANKANIKAIVNDPIHVVHIGHTG